MAKEKLTAIEIILHQLFRQLILHDSFCVGLMISRRRKNVVTKNIKKKSKPLQTEDCLESEGKAFCRFRETRHMEISVQLGFPLVRSKNDWHCNYPGRMQTFHLSPPHFSYHTIEALDPKNSEFLQEFHRGRRKRLQLGPSQRRKTG